jgi:hypothetical protein
MKLLNIFDLHPNKRRILLESFHVLHQYSLHKSIFLFTSKTLLSVVFTRGAVACLMTRFMFVCFLNYWRVKWNPLGSHVSFEILTLTGGTTAAASSSLFVGRRGEPVIVLDHPVPSYQRCKRMYKLVKTTNVVAEVQKAPTLVISSRTFFTNATPCFYVI